MEFRYEREGAAQRILNEALALSGLSEPPAAADALLRAAVSYALNITARGDVPYEMEGALALILSELYRDGFSRPVGSVRRGDTAITYAGGSDAHYRALLAPFVRLKTV